MNIAPRPRRPLNGGASFALSLVFVLVVALLAAAGNILADALPGAAGLAVVMAINITVMAVTLGAGVWWWSRLDEAAREAHKWAWWWGGTSGLAVAGAVMLTVSTRGLDLPVLSGRPGLMTGILLLLLCQTVGYAVAWAVWWLQRR